jgi:hypothetical protein
VLDPSRPEPAAQHVPPLNEGERIGRERNAVNLGGTWTGDRAVDGDEQEYFCPICGIPLAQSDFDKPEDQYFCPFCSTRQTPAVV